MLISKNIFHLTCNLKHSLSNELGFYDFGTGEGMASGYWKGRSCGELVILQHNDRSLLFQKVYFNQQIFSAYYMPSII